MSLGTERTTVKGSKDTIFDRARKNPEKVLNVIKQLSSDGIKNTIESLNNQLDQLISLGYCNVGKIIEVGENISDLKAGDRVVSNGSHSEFVSIARNLVCKIPDKVSDESAAFTVVGSIALQGVRLSDPEIGETVAVYGLGLIGLLTIQILKSNGCNVIGIDIDDKKCSMAQSFGITTYNCSQDLGLERILELNNNHEFDAVIITATNSSNQILNNSAKICRKKGRIVLVGVVGLSIDRDEFYKKEITFQVSCSYGPGRYDQSYESMGIDYPFHLVRWTENRNFETILNLLDNKNIEVNQLISKEVFIDNFDEIYKNISKSSLIGAILKYQDIHHEENDIDKVFHSEFKPNDQSIGIGFIGAGGFTESIIIPKVKKLDVNLVGICSKTGFSSSKLAKKFGFNYSSSDIDQIIDDKNIDTVFITTRHNLHSKFVVKCLANDKNVFVEKPLCLNFNELDQIVSAYKGNKSLTVGYNRRFSPHSKAIKKYLMNSEEPVSIIINVNAGFIPSDSWVHDINIGGGRIVGEACHFIDLCSYLSGSKIESVYMDYLGTDYKKNNDSVVILLKFNNGSIASINYFSSGSSKYSKERVEVYSKGRTWIIDDFKRTYGYDVKGFSSLKTKQDKGHQNQFNSLINQINSGSNSIIPFDEIINVSKATISSLESIKNNNTINLAD